MIVYEGKGGIVVIEYEGAGGVAAMVENERKEWVATVVEGEVDSGK